MNTKLFGAVISIAVAVIVFLLGVFLLAYGFTLMPSWIKLTILGTVIVYLSANYILGMITEYYKTENNG